MSLVDRAVCAAGGIRPLARDLGCPPKTIQRWISGERRPDARSVRSLCAYLGIAPLAPTAALASFEAELERLAETDSTGAYAHALALYRGEVSP
jgi:transcriptional regulator with XRE-family HTH domain